ncbi:MAG TPA: SDR family NAD(P)-dependent oxidoreductase [Puia sp.]|nr:SDR family NAD(P)-dependent oxidoreductase [Puia sp.]
MHNNCPSHQRPSDSEPRVRRAWFITGASHGLGLSLVKQLLVRGDQVAATTRDPQRLSEQVRNDIPVALIRNFLPLQVDLTDEYAIEQSIALAHKTFGRIDVVVNNAGYAPGVSMEELSASEIHQCFAINTTASMTVMYKALPYLRQQQSGYILNISSMAACMAATDSCLYAATKYATLGLSELLKEEAHRSNVSITVLAPVAFQPRLHARDYDMWENIRDSNQAATNLILLAEQTTPPPILLVGDSHITTHRKEADDTSLRLHNSIK